MEKCEFCAQTLTRTTLTLPFTYSTDLFIHHPTFESIRIHGISARLSTTTVARRLQCINEPRGFLNDSASPKNVSASSI